MGQMPILLTGNTFARSAKRWRLVGRIGGNENRTFLSLSTGHFLPKIPGKFVPLNLEGNLEDKTIEEGCPMKRGENELKDLTRKQIWDDAYAKCDGDSGRLKRLLDGSPRDWRDAVTAELRCPGDGIRVLEERHARR